MLRNSKEKEDYLSNRVEGMEPLLKPVASIASYKQYVPRVIATIIIEPETAY